MVQTVLISLTKEELQSVIVDCVNSCLKDYSPPVTTESTEDRWFNLPELRQYIPDRLSSKTIYGLVADGKIPVHKGAKKLRFLKSEIDDWLKSRDRKSYRDNLLASEEYFKKKGERYHG